MAHRRKSPKTKKSEIKNLENCANTKKILNQKKSYIKNS